MKLLNAFLICATFGLASPLAAQDADALAQAFGGEWYSFDPATADGGNCKLTLAPDSVDTEGTRKVTTEDCRGPLSTAARWRIAEGQIRLSTGEAPDDVAILGGNQFRITGEIVPDGRGVVIERATGDATGQAIRAALSKYKCYYRGFTNICATETDLQLPTFAEETPTAVRTLVNLNVRNQPRADATVMGVVPRETQLNVNQCLIASDGLWCRGNFSGKTGWFTRSALRDETWPILTFVPQE